MIGFDPRGVGESTAVTLLRRRRHGRVPVRHPADAARIALAGPTSCTQSTPAFAEACEANSDGILPYITTENAARDMDLLRAVLGDRELNYLGYSYGTFLGATYAKLFPERVGRLVLDGAVDPSISGLDVSTTQALGFESALRAYMADCLDGRRLPVPRHGRRGDGRPRHAARERRPRSRSPRRTGGCWAPTRS